MDNDLIYNLHIVLERSIGVMGTKESYEAPRVQYVKFDAGDILTKSGWNFDCSQSGSGDNAAPPSCDISVHTDNSQN